MIVRCPAGDHAIDVEDDMVGARIRCPHCDHLFFVEAPTGDAIQEAAPKPKPLDDAKKLGAHIYDGLPPLSLMMALRRDGRDYDAGDNAKLEMTDDDWKALAAFESVLRAAYGLRTSLVVIGMALAANLPALGFVAFNSELAPDMRRVVERTGASMTLFLLACSFVIFFGSRALEKVRTNFLVDLLTSATGACVLIFSGFVVIGICALYAVGRYQLPTGPYFVAFPLALIAIFDLSRSTYRVSRALRQIEPPEITNRIVEALKYLE